MKKASETEEEGRKCSGNVRDEGRFNKARASCKTVGKREEREQEKEKNERTAKKETKSDNGWKKKLKG